MPDPQCKLTVKVGETTAMLVDRQRTSRRYKLLSYLAPKDNVPLILGFAELLEHLKLFCDPSTDTTWLEEP